MAKNKYKNEMELDNEEKGGSRIVTVLIAVLIVLIWLAIFALLVKFDVGGFGSGVLRPILKDVPIINKILPDVSDELLAEENDYEYSDIGKANARIKELERQLESSQNSNSTSDSTIQELQAEIDRLQVFEDNQLEYEKKLKEFNEEVVFAKQAPDIEEYKKFYEEIDPTNAEEIYRQVLEQLATDGLIQEQADRFAKMDPKTAANTMQEMTGDIKLVCQILKAMKPAQSAAIMDEMDPLFNAKVVKRLSTLEEN
jgi:flagellar motility protein MotE (MotC chaperone)